MELLLCAGLSTAVAQRTLAAKGVSILEYHLLSGGGYTAAQLRRAVTVQTNLGRTLDASLPLTFGAGTAANTVRLGYLVPPQLMLCALDALLSANRQG